MSNTNLEISKYDFESICRTCLSREDLEPLYENCIKSKCLADMLMYCTSLMFAEDDGLPVKICTNCIHEINQAFSFAKRCEITDAILRKCMKIKTKYGNNSSESKKVEPIIKTEEEIILPSMNRAAHEEDAKIGIQSEIISLNTNQTVGEVWDDYDEVKQYEEVKIECEEYVLVKVKQEEDAKTEFQPEIVSLNMNQTVEGVLDDDEVKQYEEGKIEEYVEEGEEEVDVKVCSETYDDSADESCEGDEDPLETHFDKSGSRRKVSRHYQSKVGVSVRKHTCEDCKKTFKCMQDFNVHKLIHTGEKPNVCSVCDKAFTHITSLKVHMRLHTGEKPYTCKVCSKAYIQLNSLKNHMKLHTGEKPYSCDVCHKAFTQSTHLKYHMTTHAGEKSHICQVCGKAFIKIHDLQVHIRKHTGLKPHICQVCNMAFIQSNDLKVHILRKHTGESPYNCEICDKAFTRFNSLRMHMSKHTEEKPYTCKICSKAFTQPSDLKEHMKIHTGERPYSCRDCGKCFTSNGNLNSHKQTHEKHNQDNDAQDLVVI